MSPRPLHGRHPHAPADEIRALSLTTVQQIGLTMVRFGLPALAPFVRADLRLSVVQVGIVLMALDLGSFASFIPVGLATDRWGERTVLIAGGVLMGLAAAVAALAPSFAWLLAALIVAGVGFPSGHTAGSKLVMRQFPPQARGMAIGIRQSGLPAGGALAAVVIPSVAGAGGWRPALAVIGLACVLAGALCLLLPRDDRTATLPRRGVAPVRDLAADPGFVRLTLMGSMLVIGQFTLQGFLAVYLVDAHGWTAAAASRLLALVHVGGVTGRLLWGAASDRLTSARRKPVLAWIVAGAFLLLLSVAILPRGAGVWLATLVAFAGGLFMAGWNGLFINLLIERAGAERAATTIGTSLTVMFLATMASYPVFGGVVQAARSYMPAWLLVASCQVVALLILARVTEDRSSPHGPDRVPA